MLDISRLARMGGMSKYSVDEIFCSEGEPGHEMYIILKGKVGVYLNSIDGFQIKITELGAGDFFGEMSLLENMPRSATIQALEDTIVMVINENNFEQVIAQEPKLASRIMKGMSSRLRQQNEELSLLKQGQTIDDTSSISKNNSSEELILADSSLFPSGHKSYSLVAQPSDETYLFDRDIKCPVCENSFKVKMVRSSKLRLQEIEPDLRQRFNDFEPLWYAVWVCPHCYYANFNFEFKQVLESNNKSLLEQGTGLKKKFKFSFSEPRKIDEVFMSYYLILQSLQAGKHDPIKNAKVWLRLSWLYNDAGDADMYKIASARALELFKNSYFNTHRTTSVEQDQRLTLLLGELSFRTGDNEQALKYFRNTIIRKGGNHIINKQAEDRIQYLKTTITNEEK